MTLKTPLTIEKIKTDTGDNALLAKCGKSCLVYTFADLTDNQPAFFKRLQKITGDLYFGATRTKLLQLCMDAPLNPSLTAITRPGYEPVRGSAPRYYAFPSGEILTASKVSGLSFVAAFEPNLAARSYGKEHVYLDEVRRIVHRQSWPLFFFFYALAPIIQPFAGQVGYYIENCFVEAIGPSGSEKSTLTTILAGSVWGGGVGKLGFGRAWNATANALESLALDFNNILMILDEATVASGETKFNVVHRYSLAESKMRLGELGRATFESMALSNSNKPLRASIEEDEDVLSAIDVRLISVFVPKGPTGFFDSIPEGFNSIAEAALHLRTICTTNYGFLARRFIKAALKMMSEDFDAFLQTVKQHMDRFINEAGADRGNETAMRIAKPFALTFAVVGIARKAGIIDKTWGSPGRAILRAYSQYIQQAAKGDPAAMIELFLTQKHAILDLVQRDEKPELSDVDFSSYEAFKFVVKGRTCLGLTAAKVKRHFGEPKEIAKLADQKNILVANNGYRFKKRIRRRGGESVNDVFYVFDIGS